MGEGGKSEAQVHLQGAQEESNRRVQGMVGHACQRNVQRALAKHGQRHQTLEKVANGSRRPAVMRQLSANEQARPVCHASAYEIDAKIPNM